MGELEHLGVTVIAATVDAKASTVQMAQETGLTFSVAYGVNPAQVEEFDPWWTEDHHGRYIQPMEFLILRNGVLFGTMYASGPIGRMEVDEVLASVRGRERRRVEQEQAAKTI